jgi:2-polyprenyl-3-methyl-5-hydroxy-6-metoxy-1,4-benzoquinol methylase
MLNKYDSPIDLQNKNLSWTKEIEIIGYSKRVLEFGCHNGFVSKVLKERHCSITGIEIDRDAAEKAQAFCEEVIIGDVEEIDYEKVLKDKYDVALFGDVLEHLKNPENILRKVQDFLKEDGFIVISVPNIAHWSIRLQLLKGNFDYVDLGILDETHLRFFTKKSLINLLERCGYFVDQIDYVKSNVDWDCIFSVLGNDMNANLIAFFNTEEAEAFQYIIKASQRSTSNYLEKMNLALKDRDIYIAILKIRIVELEGELMHIKETKSFRIYMLFKTIIEKITKPFRKIKIQE